jgi:hypothetical protein
MEDELGGWVPVDPRDQYAIRDGVEDAFSVLEHLSPRLRQIAMLRALGMRHAGPSSTPGSRWQWRSITRRRFPAATAASVMSP